MKLFTLLLTLALLTPFTFAEKPPATPKKTRAWDQELKACKTDDEVVRVLQQMRKSGPVKDINAAIRRMLQTGVIKPDATLAAFLLMLIEDSKVEERIEPKDLDEALALLLLLPRPLVCDAFPALNDFDRATSGRYSQIRLAISTTDCRGDKAIRLAPNFTATLPDGTKRAEDASSTEMAELVSNEVVALESAVPPISRKGQNVIELWNGDRLPFFTAVITTEDGKPATGRWGNKEVPKDLIVAYTESIDEPQLTIQETLPGNTYRTSVRLYLVKSIRWNGGDDAINDFHTIPLGAGEVLTTEGVSLKYASVRLAGDEWTFLLDKGVERLTGQSILAISFPKQSALEMHRELVRAKSADAKEPVVRIQSLNGVRRTSPLSALRLIEFRSPTSNESVLRRLGIAYAANVYSIPNAGRRDWTNFRLVNMQELRVFKAYEFPLATFGFEPESMSRTSPLARISPKVRVGSDLDGTPYFMNDVAQADVVSANLGWATQFEFPPFAKRATFTLTLSGAAPLVDANFIVSIEVKHLKKDKPKVLQLHKDVITGADAIQFTLTNLDETDANAFSVTVLPNNRNDVDFRYHITQSRLELDEFSYEQYFKGKSVDDANEVKAEFFDSKVEITRNRTDNTRPIREKNRVDELLGKLRIR